MPTKSGPWEGCVWTLQRDPGRGDYLGRKAGRSTWVPCTGQGVWFCCNKRLCSFILSVHDNPRERMEAWKPHLTSQASAPPSASRREGSPLSKAWLGGTAASVSHPLENGLVSLSHLGEGRGGRAGCPPPRCPSHRRPDPLLSVLMPP